MKINLDDILAGTRRRLPFIERHLPALERAIDGLGAPPPWRPALAGGSVAVIAEIKRRSPSAGSIAPDLDAATFARAYESGGASAVSVLTDEEHFGGSLQDLRAVTASVKIPVLRKDFIISPAQLVEARAAGASAVLLITRILNDRDLAGLAARARELGLELLVEVHSEEELDRALRVEPESIGVNCRDLDTFELDRTIHETLLPRIPAGLPAVAESGMKSAEDVARAASFGADAVLIGTSIAGHDDPARLIGGMTGVRTRGRGVKRVHPNENRSDG